MKLHQPKKKRLAMRPKGSFTSIVHLLSTIKNNSDKLTDLCDSLKKSGFIHKDTTTVHFKKVFSGKE